MTFGAQRVFAFLAAVVIAAGGDRCTCAADAAGSKAVAGPTAVPCHAGAATVRPRATSAHHACCEAPEPSVAAGHAAPEFVAQGDHPSPCHVDGTGHGSPTGGPPSHQPPPSHCERCNPYLAPAPDAKATVPPVVVTAVAPAGPDRLAALLTPTAPAAAPRAAESPPAAGARTLFALRCSLLD